MTTRLTLTTPAAARSYLATPAAQAHAPSYTGEGDEVTVHRVCRRCGGTGEHSFSMVYGHSRCFDCNGAPDRARWTQRMPVTDLAREVRRRERAAVRRQEKRERLAAAREAEADRNQAAVEAALGLALDGTHRILGSLREAARRWGKLTEAQEALAKRIVAEEALPKTPAPEGRTEFTGEVVAIRTVDSVYGMTVKCRIRALDKVGAPTGWTCYGTMPAALLGEERIGHVVTMRATLTQADDDPTHAWFSRPAAARALCTADEYVGYLMRDTEEVSA